MLHRSSALLAPLAVAIAGCSYTDRTLEYEPDPSDTIELTLTRADSGELELCHDDGSCDAYPNPGNCSKLQVRIDQITGETCEVCYDADHQVKTEGCRYTNVTCTVVTAPDPDCVVCAYVGGEVIFSTCTTEEPECVWYSESFPQGGASSSDAGACRICYDASGRAVLRECPEDCAAIGCPPVTCPDGFASVRAPGECCATCVPSDDCTEEVCALDFAPPTCPEGTVLVRDPADCCHYWCQAAECPRRPEGATEPAPACPAGYEWVDAYPECGRCVPIPVEEQSCTSNADCPAGAYCSTEGGDCRSAPCATDDPDCAGASVCHGVCRPLDDVCPDFDTVVVDSRCEGDLYSAGVDAAGCPLPPTCHCPDGSISFDGACSDLCANVSCFSPMTSCADGEHLVTDYPNCCGICVPDGICVAGEDPAGNGFIQGTVGCPEVLCGPEYHIEIGPDCCEVCVRNQTTCGSDADCLPGELCESSAATGALCQPKVYCEDSDGGVTPTKAGSVHGFDGDGVRYELADHCDPSGKLIEMWCYSPFASSTQSLHTSTVVSCPQGCDEGACL